jgi:hypothetical protein
LSSVYGAQINNQFVKVIDLLNKEDDTLLKEHLQQIFEIVYKENNIKTFENTPDLHSIAVFIDGIYIT